MRPVEPLPKPEVCSVGDCNQGSVLARQTLYQWNYIWTSALIVQGFLLRKHSSKKKKWRRRKRRRRKRKRKRSCSTQYLVSRKSNYPSQIWMQKYRGEPLVILALTVEYWQRATSSGHLFQKVLLCFSVAVRKCWPNSAWEGKGVFGLQVLSISSSRKAWWQRLQ